MPNFGELYCKKIRSWGVWAWGHIDDFIVTGHDYEELLKISKQIQSDLTSSQIKLNEKKSTLISAQSIEFLEAIWTSQTIKRRQEVSQKLFNS